MTEGVNRQAERESSPCGASLRAFGGGDLRAWWGLPPGCTRADAEASLGPSRPGPDGIGRLGGSPTGFRTYPATAFAPHGVIVWLAGDDVVLLQVNSPALEEPLEAMLGAPEERARSLLDYGHSQWIYASRGLAAHVSSMTSVVLRLYGCFPTTVEEYLASWLSQVSVRRVELKRR